VRGGGASAVSPCRRGPWVWGRGASAPVFGGRPEATAGLRPAAPHAAGGRRRRLGHYKGGHSAPQRGAAGLVLRPRPRELGAVLAIWHGNQRFGLKTVPSSYNCAKFLDGRESGRTPASAGDQWAGGRRAAGPTGGRPVGDRLAGGRRAGRPAGGRRPAAGGRTDRWATRERVGFPAPPRRAPPPGLRVADEELRQAVGQPGCRVLSPPRIG
jgi:hypothetical protein